MSINTNLENGRPWPLGAHCDGNGVNFAIFSANAASIDLCIFDAQGSAIQQELRLPECTNQVWHGYLPKASPGLIYAYRVTGPQNGENQPEQGHRFDPQRLMLDPYAREVVGNPSQGLKARVVNERFDWGNDTRPETSWSKSILYEVHVKGATQLHPGIPAALRGTYAGLCSPVMIDHFRNLGITAVNLLPVHYFLDEERLLQTKRVNYWGYNSLSFFAPTPRYAANIGGQSVSAEFKTMVRAFHAAGIEVILDVVFNHTAETDEYGPVLSFRGIDNASYYRLSTDNPTYYENFSGCGNTLNLAHPRVLQLVLDSLRFWADEMRVDGFRFDLATALTRDSAFLAAISQDPLLSRLKLIAEPWDLGPDGYQLGKFPPGWSEWNDRFRDEARAFWLTRETGVDGLAQRLAGSSELFFAAGRAPQAGINFITAHDGFTLRDVVSYQTKHNESNGENNQDGHNFNHSWNCGEEGDTGADPLVKETRRSLQRALLATLFIGQGVPMLQGGDELGRTQAGNNNAYCQDNAITWFDWEQADSDLIDYVAGLITLRQRFPQLRQHHWLTGKPNANGQHDIIWWHPSGRQMQIEDWQSPDLDSVGFILAPTLLEGDKETVLCLINRAAEGSSFALPPGQWRQRCASSAINAFAPVLREGTTLLPPRSLKVLSRS